MPTPLKEKCVLCGASHTCWGYGPDDEFDPENDPECTGVFCDFIVDGEGGCFKHYCKECFPKHTCSVHKGTK